MVLAVCTSLYFGKYDMEVTRNYTSVSVSKTGEHASAQSRAGAVSSREIIIKLNVNKRGLSYPLFFKQKLEDSKGLPQYPLSFMEGACSGGFDV